MNIINIPQIVESGRRGVSDEGEQGEELCHKQIMNHIITSSITFFIGMFMLIQF